MRTPWKQTTLVFTTMMCFTAIQRGKVLGKSLWMLSCPPLDSKRALAFPIRKKFRHFSCLHTTQSDFDRLRGGALFHNRSLATSKSKPENTSAKQGKDSNGKGTKKKRNTVFRALRQGAGNLISAVGFVSSSFASLITDRTPLQERGEALFVLRQFLNTSGIEAELAPSLNRHLGRNLILLQYCQANLQERIERVASKRRKHNKQNQELLGHALEARRMMRFATAAYGRSMIQAARLDVKGEVFMPWNKTEASDEFTATDAWSADDRAAISSHTGIPPQDLALLDVHYGGDSQHLRHFVALDHQHKSVVLSIRGTYSLQEILVDVTAFSKPYCGGEGHSEMTAMAQRVWDKAGPTILKLLKENPSYGLILTGHSLGAGTACLLNLDLHSATHQNARELRGRSIECIAFAAPPVFAPLDVAPRKALESCTNYIHQNDCVSFLSIDSIRQSFGEIRAIHECVEQEKRSKKLTSWKLFQVAVGNEEIPPQICQALESARSMPLPPKQGAPSLLVPAAKTVWLHQDDASSSYCATPIVDSSDKLAHLGIRFHSNMLTDHFPSRYEHALDEICRVDHEFAD